MTPAPRAKSTPLTTKTLLRALDILEAFATPGGEIGITDLARRLDLHKNNVFRLVSTLQANGYVEQNRLTGNYRLGSRIFVLGQLYVHRMGMLRQARPVMEEIVAASDETCAVAIAKGRSVVFLDSVESSRTVRVAPRQGHLLPLWATAFGRVLLASLSEEEARAILGEGSPVTLHRPAPSPASFLADLEVDRTNGYCLLEATEEDGVTEIAAPILDHSHRVVAAIGILGPAHRFPPDLVEGKLLPLVLAGAKEISRRLGYA
jgi:DNA-binding IclR family transcriptional regulator